jgi:DNA-binding HxlR family transcriptional regulator
MASTPLVSLCPRYHHAVELIGRRWTGAIIRMLLPGRARFNTLRAAVPEISDRMLSERLRELEAEGLIVREVIPDLPVRVEYELTAKGQALQDVVDAIGTWAQEWLSDDDVSASASPMMTRTDDRRPTSSSKAAASAKSAASAKAPTSKSPRKSTRGRAKSTRRR